MFVRVWERRLVGHSRVGHLHRTSGDKSAQRCEDGSMSYRAEDENDGSQYVVAQQVDAVEIC